MKVTRQNTLQTGLSVTVVAAQICLPSHRRLRCQRPSAAQCVLRSGKSGWVTTQPHRRQSTASRGDVDLRTYVLFHLFFVVVAAAVVAAAVAAAVVETCSNIASYFDSVGV